MSGDADDQACSSLEQAQAEAFCLFTQLPNTP